MHRLISSFGAFWPSTKRLAPALLLALGGLGLVLLLRQIAPSAPPTFAPEMVIPRAMPPITDPPTVPAAGAAQRLDESELVLGVVVGGKARAYPINMLTGPRREIVNDRLGGQAIAATW